MEIGFESRANGAAEEDEAGRRKPPNGRRFFFSEMFVRSLSHKQHKRKSSDEAENVSAAGEEKVSTCELRQHHDEALIR